MPYPKGLYKGKWKRPDLSEYNRKRVNPLPMLGKKHSQETKEKQSKAKIGKPNLKLRGRKFSLESRKKMSLSRTGKKRLSPRFGELAPGWKGGLTKAGRSERLSTRYVSFRRSVLLRDCYTCVRCGDAAIQLHVHHIKSFSKNPEMRYDVNNAETLCIPCHEKEHPGIYLRMHSGRTHGPT